MHAYQAVMARYLDFRGRSSRSEFWSFTFWVLVISITARLVDHGLGTGSLIATIVFAIHLIPSLAVQVRRLHDVDRSGWCLLLAPTLVGLVPLLIWLTSKGKTDEATADDFDQVFPLRTPTGQHYVDTVELGSVEPERRLASAQIVYAPPAKQRRSVGAILLLIVGIFVGVWLFADANAIPLASLLPSASTCSTDLVRGLVAQIIKDKLKQTELALLPVIDLDKSDVVLDAIRTCASDSIKSECAAQATISYAPKGNMTAAQLTEFAVEIG
ncbi:DUF805 domain-containing protein [Lichenihabitans psoromatis]|uniref:DUF805 domain-containing protein n=1 Tax=Lichenihabitans psoromatis TaxID=2528642 RepID=UPI00103849C6|nr:DUF805 domain-containing protein [Lichenihabitans psoromatis]